MASSSSSRPWEFDVFLSFRGEDTRHNILSHLYTALTYKGIKTFKDDRDLEKGDPILEELQKAIEGSRFAVVVLSETYTTSRWCLMELQLIMELVTQGRLIVFPVFYKVDPSMVRYQTESLGERYQDRELAETILRWGKALKHIASHSGVDSQNCVDEATMVRDIAQDISRRVTLMRKIGSDNIVGMEAHMKQLTSLLELEVNDVRMIGIWGMGGIGKTHIASCLYDQHSPIFTAHCFTKISKDHDLKHLQTELLYSTIRDNIRLWSVDAGREEIKARLANQKVLLVLDGVDNEAQVDTLAKISWFGPGSRIIITTRDKSLLNSFDVKTIYEVKCMDDKDSLEMFKQIAFEGRQAPSDDFEELSDRASQLAHGLPSAIRAYALFLRQRQFPEEWEQAICRLNSNVDNTILEMLKLSYQGLPKRDQNAFLQVACLFNGENLQRVISLLDGPKDETNLSILFLVEKSLIKRSNNGDVIMHKLVEQMGREIMCECKKFLWNPEEVRDALAYGEGTTEKTECLVLHTCEMTCAFSMKTSVFDSMYNLKFLKVYKHVDDRESILEVIQDTHHLPRKLRLFHWDGFPLRTMPSRYSPDQLIELNLRHSSVETLWSEKQVFRRLKRLDVTGSKNLKRLPDLPDLEELILERCTRLEGIPQSIGRMSTLRKLKLSHFCGPLTIFMFVFTRRLVVVLEFPNAKVEMEALMNISIEGEIMFSFSSEFTGNAEYFSYNSEQQIPMTPYQQAPQLILELKRISSLNIQRFSHEENGVPPTLRSFADFSNLKKLKLVNLNILEIPHEMPDGIGKLKLLEILDLSGNDFEKLPDVMSSLSQLKTLCLRNCSKLEELPELTQVQTLTLSNCRNLRSLVKHSDASQDLGRYGLLELCLENCNSVESLSDQLSHFTRLTYLNLSSHDFETMPPSIRDLSSLVTLCLNNCKKLKSVEELPLSLRFLYAHGCDSLKADNLKHFKGKLYKESTYFEEVEIYAPTNQGRQAGRKESPAQVPTLLMFLNIPNYIMVIVVLVIFLPCVFYFRANLKAQTIEV